MIKFIIATKSGQLRHFKSDWENHDNIARHNNVDPYSQVIETGLIVDSNVLILECSQAEHKLKHFYNKVMFDPGILRARQTESVYSYKVKSEGD
jgi:hypothetical protein